MNATRRNAKKITHSSRRPPISPTLIRNRAPHFLIYLLSLLAFAPVAQALYDTGIVGTSGGTGFRVDCGEGSVLAGVTAVTSRNRMDAISAHCVDVDAQGQWQGDPEQQAEYGKRFGSSQAGTALCPADHAVVGFTGARGTESYFVN